VSEKGIQSCQSHRHGDPTSCSRKATTRAFGRPPDPRTIEQHVEGPLSEALLRGEFSPGTVLWSTSTTPMWGKEGREGSAAASGVQAGRECGDVKVPDLVNGPDKH